MRAKVSATAAFVLTVLLAAAAPGYAQALPPSLPPQASPPPGFVPPYEIMRTVHAAGFDPLAPPLREGTTYVLRATDFRGILMRVVVDARTGAIRDANRIVPGPGSYGPDSDGQLGMMAPYEASPDDTPPPYGPPPPFGGSEMAPSGRGAMQPPGRPSTARGATRAIGVTLPPLPRPRPAELAARKPAPSDVNADAKPEATPTAAAPTVVPRKEPVVSSPLND